VFLERSGHPLLHLHDPLLVTLDATAFGTVPAQPALAPWCRLVKDRGRVLVEHGGTVVTLEGRAATALLPRLLPLLDGTRTTAEIAEALGQVAGPAVSNALALLAGNGLLVEGPLAPTDADACTETATFAASLTGLITQAAARERLAAARVAVLGSGAVAKEIRRLQRQSGVGWVHVFPADSTPPEVSLVVAAPSRTEVPALERLNELALERRQPWLQVLPYDGRFVVAGPLFLPGASACRACWLTRRAACSGYEDDFALVERQPARAPSSAPVIGLGAALASVVAVRWLTTADPGLPGRYYALETRAIMHLRFDHLLRVPRCATCGPPTSGVPSPWFEPTA
jgi:bacteriocin biosynthesis cyclodehydratase domain-containing protein